MFKTSPSCAEPHRAKISLVLHLEVVTRLILISRNHSSQNGLPNFPDSIDIPLRKAWVFKARSCLGKTPDTNRELATLIFADEFPQSISFFFLSYTCEQGYEFQSESGQVLQGPVTVTCSQDATWVPETPGRCVRES